MTAWRACARARISPCKVPISRRERRVGSIAGGWLPRRTGEAAIIERFGSWRQPPEGCREYSDESPPPVQRFDRLKGVRVGTTMLIEFGALAKPGPVRFRTARREHSRS